MVDVKEAVAKSCEYLRQVIPAEKLANLLVEEAELEDREEAWLITLGFDAGETEKKQEWNPLRNTAYVEIPKRTYKQFRVDAKTGVVTAMRIRKVE